MQINHAIEVANLLRHNLVQGVREQGDEDAKWGAFSFLHGDLSYADIWIVIELRIHEEIERGDNDSIKVAGKNVKVDKPCSAQ